MSTIFGNKIRTLREEKQIPQRQLAAALEIDTATYCKIEKGDRRAKREQVTTLADLLEVDPKELILLWSAAHLSKINLFGQLDLVLFHSEIYNPHS
jgi:transcriptional regulator with XRE-family HTH domain